MEITEWLQYQESYLNNTIKHIKILLKNKGPISKSSHKLSFFNYYKQVKNNVTVLYQNGTDNEGRTIEQLVKQGYYHDFINLLEDLKKL